jgi:hypothetical protein
MTSALLALTVDARDPSALARFWADLLGRSVIDDGGQIVVVAPPDGGGLVLRFRPGDAAKVGQNRLHLDLTSMSPDDQRTRVARALELGGRHVDVGQGPDEPHVVLADPEGNEFCVVEPGNAFLAGCGLVGAVACDG